MRNMGTQAEACGYGLRETDNTKYIPPSIKPSYKTKSQPIEGRAVGKHVEKHPCYGCGMLGHKKVTCRFDKSTLPIWDQQRINYWWLSLVHGIEFQGMERYRGFCL